MARLEEREAPDPGEEGAAVSHVVLIHLAQRGGLDSRVHAARFSTAERPLQPVSIPYRSSHEAYCNGPRSRGDGRMSKAGAEARGRSEERRVGKECRSGWARYQKKKTRSK